MAVGRRVTVYNPLLCERVATLAEATDPIQGICATMPGLLVTSDTGGHVRVFDSTCHELLQTLQLVPSGMLPRAPRCPNNPNERPNERPNDHLPGTFRHAPSRRATLITQMSALMSALMTLYPGLSGILPRGVSPTLHHTLLVDGSLLCAAAGVCLHLSASEYL